MPTDPTTSRRSVALGAFVLVITAAITAAAGCSDPADPVTRPEYLAALEAICVSTTEEFAALPSPPEQISVADFATSAAGLLDNEAARVGRLVVPDADGGDDPDGDHRAFVRNTEEQADAWRAIAETDPAGSDDLAASTQLIAQLVGGRNGLAEEMGALDCIRGDL